jgi:hypothetical protein
MTCNPANFWAYHYFKTNQRRDINGNWIDGKENNSRLIESSMLDNKDHLPEDYLKDQLSMDDAYKRRFVFGEWTTDILLKGTVFAKEYIRRLEFNNLVPQVKEGCNIYEQYNHSEIYQIGVDPSEGIIDPSAIVVVAGSGKVVATFSGMVTIPELADKIKFLYYMYGKPKVIPEVNKSSLLEHIKDLNIYRRRQMDYKDRRETEKLGFITSWASKQALISHFQDLLRNADLKIWDKRIVEEMKTFVWSDEATMQGAGASRGFHDDFIIATMLAFWEFSPKMAERIEVARSMRHGKKKFQYK